MTLLLLMNFHGLEVYPDFPLCETSLGSNDSIFASVLHLVSIMLGNGKALRPAVKALSCKTLIRNRYHTAGSPLVNHLAVLYSSIIANAVYDETPKRRYGFDCVLAKKEVPSDYKPSHWAIFEIFDNDRTVFLSFRGSISHVDWITNCSFVPMRHPVYPGVRIHAGYYAEIDVEYDELIEQLRMRSRNSKRIVITGHSKGGALSHAFIDRLLNDDKVEESLKQKVVAITFAAPMVFFYSDFHLHNSILSRDHIHNFVMKDDIVPYSPYILSIDSVAVKELLRLEVNKIPGLGHINSLTYGTASLLLGNEVERCGPYLRNFKPVGTTYISSLPKNSSGEVEFEPHDPHEFIIMASIAKRFSVDAHSMDLYHESVLNSNLTYPELVLQANKSDLVAQNELVAYLSRRVAFEPTKDTKETKNPSTAKAFVSGAANYLEDLVAAQARDYGTQARDFVISKIRNSVKQEGTK